MYAQSTHGSLLPVCNLLWTQNDGQWDGVLVLFQMTLQSGIHSRRFPMPAWPYLPGSQFLHPYPEGGSLNQHVSKIPCCLYLSGTVISNQGGFCSPGGNWQHLETFLVLTIKEEGVLLAFGGGHQGRWSVSYRAQDAPHQSLRHKSQ